MAIYIQEGGRTMHKQFILHIMHCAASFLHMHIPLIRPALSKNLSAITE